MDFDEYDYLEKTVENPEPKKVEETGNGVSEATMKSGEKDVSRSSKHKSDNDGYHHSKRYMSGSESRDHGRSREKGSSHHRSRSRDGERDRNRGSTEHRERERHGDRYKDREERNGKNKHRVGEKDRHKDRDQDRDHGHERDRDKISRERDSERVKEREGLRQSRSPSERPQVLDEKERGRGREYKERDGNLRDRNKENRRKKEEGAEPEADPERDQRTVFAYQITLKADERDVYEFFSRAGKVRDVRLIMDRNTRRSKGVGYVEFYDAMSVPMAIALSGQPLLGLPVMVKPSEAEKNLVQSTTAVGSVGLTGPHSGGARKLYVGNLHFNITEDQLRQVFESFGTVELVQLPLDETGHCKGFGFVQFARLEDSRSALTLNGNLEIAGRVIKVSAVTDQTGIQDVGTNTGDFDDDEGGGLSLNARSRAMLMQKLDRSGTAPSIAESLSSPLVSSVGVTAPGVPIVGAGHLVSPLVPPIAQNSASALYGLPGTGLQVPAVSIPSIDTIGTPSECLLLKNMFDPKLETDPDFDLDIKEDVQEECSKFGNLKHIFVDKNSTGFVYLRFENPQSAISAQRALHGRWFAGKMVTATFMVPQTYETKFPEIR